MIEHHIGDMFSSKAPTLVDPVNTVGAMGKGLALEFRRRYPSLEEPYRRRCADGSFTIGRLMLLKVHDRHVLLIPTKRHWRQKSEISYIEQALANVKRNLHRFPKDEDGRVRIAFPPLGCGLGGLSWNAVPPLFDVFDDNPSVAIEIWTPYRKEDPTHRNGAGPSNELGEREPHQRKPQ